MIFYHLLCFTDYVPNPDTRHQVGWSVVSVISINLIINISLIAKDILRDILTQVRRKIAVRRGKKMDKKAVI